MTHPVGLEDIEPGHWVAWDFACPGLTGKGDTPDAAAKTLAQVLGDEVQVVEVFNGYFSDEDPEYYVNAFFEDDKRPLSEGEIERGLAMLAESRKALQRLMVEAKDYLDVKLYDEHFGTINGVLRHVAVAEWWYCHRLGGTPNWDDFPRKSRAALNLSRQKTTELLPTLVGDIRIVPLVGETWSARKVLRRAVWHERDHIGHIREMLKQMTGSS